MHPQFLIMDEPSAGLDPIGRERIFSQVKKWHEKNKFSVILVTHNMEDIARLANRLLVMKQGKIVLDGHPIDLFLNHRKELLHCGVDVPPLTDTLLYLKDRGIPVPEKATEIKDAINKMAGILKGESYVD